MTRYQPDGLKSFAAWACRPGEERACMDWVEARGDMKRIRLVLADGYQPRGAHVSIYVWGGAPK